LPVTCPVTGMLRHEMSEKYPETISPGYTARQFIRDFPDFGGILVSPFNGARMLGVTQEHLDKVLKQKSKTRYSVHRYRKDFPNAPISARQVKIFNPYTGKMVRELTPEMLVRARTTVVEHLRRFAKYHLNQRYQEFVRCPFTGKYTHKITKRYLRKIGRTAMEFYAANCKYPLRKWQAPSAEHGLIIYGGIWSRPNTRTQSRTRWRSTSSTIPWEH